MDNKIKTVLITGACGGLGKTLVKEFDKGNNLILFDCSDNVLNLKEELDISGEILSFVGDVSNENDINVLIENVIEKFGTIDVLVSNAGIFIPGNIEELNLGDWKKSFDINVTGTYLLCKKVIPIMKRNSGGHIITVASHYGLVGGYQSSSYCASKGALIQLTKSIALDYAKDKIFANCVCPGFMDTGMLKGILKDIGMNRNWMDVMRGLPISKISINEVAENIYSLSTTKSMTGTVVTIDGGYTAR
ncbi:MAG: SDR family NAD(P)-dependent oxidoreductase [Clostridium sp.]